MENKVELPIIAGKEPAKVEVESGKSYLWCRCGRSSTQPYCDGSHRGTNISPLKIEPKKLGLRGCVSVNRPQMRHFAMEHMLLWVS